MKEHRLYVHGPKALVASAWSKATSHVLLALLLTRRWNAQLIEIGDLIFHIAGFVADLHFHVSQL